MSSAARRLAPLFTYEGYRHLPEDGKRYEVFQGELVVSPAPTSIHQTVSRRLLFALMNQLEIPKVAYVFHAPYDVILSESTIVQPDLVVVRMSRKEIIARRGVEAEPDLVIEILSDYNRDRDERTKRGLYATFKIPEYWIVDPEHGWVYVLTFDTASESYVTHKRFDRASISTSPAFEQISIPLAPIFETLALKYAPRFRLLEW